MGRWGRDSGILSVGNRSQQHGGTIRKLSDSTRAGVGSVEEAGSMKHAYRFGHLCHQMLAYMSSDGVRMNKEVVDEEEDEDDDVVVEKTDLEDNL